MILNQNEVSLLEGNSKFQSFFFNARDIFEKYVRTIIINFLADRYTVDKSVGKSNKRYGISLENKFTKQPDILIYDKNSELRLILDAKYKHKIIISDFQQAGNYIRELMIDIDLPIEFRNCILIYQSSVNTTNEEKIITIGSLIKQNTNRGGSVYAYPIDLNKVNKKKYIEKWV